MAALIFIAAACTPQATPTAAPVQAISTLPSSTPLSVTTEEETQTAISSLTPTITLTPTNVVSGNVVTLGNALFFITADGRVIACPLNYCRYEKLISELTNGGDLAYAFYYSQASDVNRIAIISGFPTKIWFDGIVRTCDTPCQGEYANMPYYRFDLAIKSFNSNGDGSIAKIIEDARTNVETGLYCMPSGARFGEIFPCNNMPTNTPTVVPSPTLIPSNTPTFTPLFTPVGTATPH